MLNSYFINIQNGIDVKDNLLKLKQELKDKDFSVIPELIKKNTFVFTELLSDKDPKIRKNAVLILGILKADEYIEQIFDAYISDETNYNKAAYLKTVSQLDSSSISDKLLKRRRNLLTIEISEDNKKHIIEELHELNCLLQPSFNKHIFTGFDLVNEFVLLTNRNFKYITADRLEGIPHKEFTAGVMVKTKQLDAVGKKIRTYSELLFVPDNIKICSNDPAEAVRALIDAKVPEYIISRIDNNDSPVFFRTEYKNKDIKKASLFEHKFSEEFEYATKWNFVNSTSDYEIEIRFIDTSGDRLVVLIKFCMLEDKRFTYRKKSLSVSIKPSTAALLAELSKTYMTDNAAVLDPFCGCATMLVEREKCKPARLYYGIDIFAEAVAAAHTNISEAGLAGKTELITKDFFEFKHNYKFNEIFTDMPVQSGTKSALDIEEIYKKFFKKIPSLLEKNAKLFIYTRNRDFLRKYVSASKMHIISEFEISKMEKSYFYIISVDG